MRCGSCDGAGEIGYMGVFCVTCNGTGRTAMGGGMDRDRGEPRDDLTPRDELKKWRVQDAENVAVKQRVARLSRLVIEWSDGKERYRLIAKAKHTPGYEDEFVINKLGADDLGEPRWDYVSSVEKDHHLIGADERERERLRREEAT